uniref:Transmembrane protein 214 n=2 Tax=Biomphalaria glabrata TaxID=6526 RepID=A0A2C9KWJ8_BIOGL
MQMASATQWEVVGKSKVKKTKSNLQTVSKSQKKQFLEKMPRIESLAPVKEDKTIYSAFLEKEQQAEKNKDAKAVNGPNKKPVIQKKKKPEQDSKKMDKIVSVDAAISQIDPQELESTLSLSKDRFPENQDVWLKDLASFLNLKFENVKESESSLNLKGKPQGYPLEYLPTNSQKVLKAVVKKFSNQTLDSLFDYCIQMMLTESTKDRPTMGYRIFLQVLAHHKPEIVLGKLHQYLELLKTHQNRPSHCVSILWAVGQCGVKNFSYGMNVWLDLMLPALEIRQVAYYPIEYLEYLLGTQKQPSSATCVVALRDYFKVLDIVFNPGFNLANDLKKRLLALYPSIKELAFGETPAQTLRTFFPSYLARFNPSLNPALKLELLECMVKCLTTDKQSFSVWCQLYLKHLTASGFLLEYINHEWSRLSSLFDKKLLRETQRAFSVTNDEIEAQGKGDKGFPLCQAATKELAMKINHSSFPWFFLIFLLISLVGSIVAYDIWSSPSIYASRTMRFLEHYGILMVLEQAWSRINTFVSILTEWLKLNCPVYYAYICETVGPFVLYIWASIKDFLITSEVVTRPHRIWMGEKALHLYQWVYDLSPETWTWCYQMSLVAWEMLKNYTLWLWKHSTHLFLDVYHWVEHHLLMGSLSKDSLQATANWSLHQVQTYMEMFWSWCNANILTLVK